MKIKGDEYFVIVLQKKRWNFKIREPGFTHSQYSLPCITDVQAGRSRKRARKQARLGWAKKREKWRGGSERKKEEKQEGVRKEKFFPHRTRSQLRSLRVLLDMNSCYAGCLNFHWLNTTWTLEPCLVGLETQSFYLYWMKYIIFFFPGWTSFTAVLFPGNLWRFLIPHQTASDLLKVTLALHSSSCLDSFALVAFQFPDS